MDIGLANDEKSWMSYRKSMKMYAFGGGCRAIVDGNASDMLAQSFSDEQQYACMASSASESEEDSSPEAVLVEVGQA